jgi:hypothetical protein
MGLAPNLAAVTAHNYAIFPKVTAFRSRKLAYAVAKQTGGGA